MLIQNHFNVYPVGPVGTRGVVNVLFQSKDIFPPFPQGLTIPYLITELG